MRNPVFPGVRTPTIDFQAVRDGRRSTPLYFQINLDVARSIVNGITSDITDVSGKALQLNIAGNAWWSDPLYDSGGNYIAGVIVAHFQDTALGSGVSTPITILPNSSQRVPFTTLTLENFAQAGKKARLVYGVDLDFVPGFNAQNTIGGTVDVRDTGYLYGSAFASTALITAGTPLNALAAATNVNGVRLHDAESGYLNATGATEATLLAKATAPTTIIDGDVIVSTKVGLGATTAGKGWLQKPVRIASGKRLDFMVGTTDTGGLVKKMLYDVL